MGWLIDLAKAAGLEPMPAADPTSGPMWWRVRILESGGRIIEVDAPSGWALPDWQAYAAHYHVPGCTVTPLARLPKPQAPASIDEALAAASVAGITPAQFGAMLSSEDLDDVEAGAIPVETLRAYAESFADGIRSGRIVVPRGEP